MTEKRPVYQDDIAGYRQPMVTSIGIIMGFLLSFLANTAIQPDALHTTSRLVFELIVFTLVISVGLFVAVLFRLLDNRIYDDPGWRYQATLRIYMGALTLAFGGLTVAMFL
jgi:hypothetical protein